jgi:single-stranded-DNA-specific exonuclease
MTWILSSTPDPSAVAQLQAALATELPFPQPLAQVLVRRGVDSQAKARTFFKPQLADLPDPRQMRDMPVAVGRLVRAFQQGEQVMLLGDYDVDGTTSVAMMKLALDELGYQTTYYIPDRYNEGYGLSFQGIDHAVEVGAQLLITLDCGIKATEKVRYANLKGLEVIICDHHTPGRELPQALAVLDPKRPDCDYPYAELTGCGVAMKLLMALVEEMRLQGLQLPEENYQPFARYCDLLVLSIACDIVPITGENRIMAYHGLHKLRQDPLPGIAALKAQARDKRDWNISDLVFFLGPRINSAGRLHHAHGAVEVLLGRQQDLIDLAQALHHSNETRKALDQDITQQAMASAMADPDFAQAHTTVLCGPDWHKGIIGIVASRLVEAYYRPTVLLTQSNGKLVGSARSVPGFDLYQALEACDEHLLQWGGHKYAAGLTLEPEQYPAFKARFEAAVAQYITPEQRQPITYLDAEVSFESIDARLVRLINRMEPFGPSNRRPTFLARNVLVRYATIMKEDHVRLTLQQGQGMWEAVGFNLAEKYRALEGQVIDVAFQPFFNTWNQKTRLNLRLKDIKSAHEALYPA